MSFDFTNRPELTSLAQVVSALDGVAAPLGCDYLVIGATARDIMLRHAYKIDVTRMTEDVDFSVMVRDWEAFTELRDGLIGGGGFSEREAAVLHKLRHVVTQLPIDVVRFGGVENPDRTIAWPPEHEEIFDCVRLRARRGAPARAGHTRDARPRRYENPARHTGAGNRSRRCPTFGRAIGFADSTGNAAASGALHRIVGIQPREGSMNSASLVQKVGNYCKVLHDDPEEFETLYSHANRGQPLRREAARDHNR